MECFHIYHLCLHFPCRGPRKSLLVDTVTQNIKNAILQGASRDAIMWGAAQLPHSILLVFYLPNSLTLYSYHTCQIHSISTWTVHDCFKFIKSKAELLSPPQEKPAPLPVASHYQPIQWLLPETWCG